MVPTAPGRLYPKGDATIPMAWAAVGGYHGENERTLIVGVLAGVRERAYQAMPAAREFTAHGFGDILPGRVGHGVGLSAHEFPSLAKDSALTLRPGMVITVEPGLMDTGEEPAIRIPF